MEVESKKMKREAAAREKEMILAKSKDSKQKNKSTNVPRSYWADERGDGCGRQHMRVDPMKYSAEFEKDLSELKPSSGVDREVSGSEAVADSPTVEASKMEKQRQDKIQKHQVLPKSCRLRLLNEQKQIRLISLKKQAKGQSDGKLIRGLRQMAQIGWPRL
ncbi:hypothetical protein MRB53_014049 [Persea americana]|uniref:Uncharacterized protein n=1 Tax=Persea americana TaxID=3435 RepID=A0ACC2KAB7_PERAE|nr:hypothetical protein MRB53_014049 [Persea americana]